MSDTRHKNGNWKMEANPDGSLTIDRVQCALLMDIRDELQAMCRRLDCPETLEMPRLLKAIKKNTTKRRYRRKVVSA
jgi:hypothetical protein